MTDKLAFRNGVTIVFEVKRPGDGVVSKIQEIRHRELRGEKIPVHVLDNLEDARHVFSA